MTLAYFCLGGLDLLAQREKIVGGNDRRWPRQPKRLAEIEPQAESAAITDWTE